MNSFSLRGGYIFPSDLGGFSAGGGVKMDMSGLILGIDYSWTDAGVFDNTHRFAVKFGF